MTPLLTLSQAAKLCGYSDSGFRKLLRSGNGPRYSRAGKGRFKFREEWLADWADQNSDKQPVVRQGKHWAA